MKLKIIIIFFVLNALSTEVYCQLDRFNSFEELDSLAGKYFDENNIDSSILVNEYARNRFPEHDEYLTIILSSIYEYKKQNDKLLETWDYGLNKRYFFGINDWRYPQLKNNPEFERLLKMDTEIRDSLNNLNHMKYEIILPENYSTDNQYPLLFVFHGNNWNLKISKSVWNSEILNEKFITAHIQSYIYMRKDRYQWWLNDEKTNIEFKALYNQIINEYSVNKENIVFTGMSKGGSIAIDYAFSEFIPVHGLVVNCPVVPNLNDSLINVFVNKNKKIAIITGENDWSLEGQKDLIQKVDSIGGNGQITVKSGIGHSIAEDFPIILNQYLNWIIE